MHTTFELAATLLMTIAIAGLLDTLKRVYRYTHRRKPKILPNGHILFEGGRANAPEALSQKTMAAKPVPAAPKVVLQPLAHYHHDSFTLLDSMGNGEPRPMLPRGRQQGR